MELSGAGSVLQRRTVLFLSVTAYIIVPLCGASYVIIERIYVCMYVICMYWFINMLAPRVPGELSKETSVVINRTDFCYNMQQDIFNT